MGLYGELYPERYTSIIQTLPEVDITDESLDTSCVLNRSRNTSLEDKGIQSTDFGTNFDSVRQRRPDSTKITSSPVKRRRPRQKSMIEKALEKLGMPAMELCALFIPLLVIIAVLYVTTPPYVDTTMETIKSDIATAELILPTAEPIPVEVESSLRNVVDEIETIPGSDYEEEKEEVMLTDLHDKEHERMDTPTAEPIVNVD